MPPKAKITKEMILQTVLEMTRQFGFEAVNARSIAERLQCSTRPLFTCYRNMEELKADFLQTAFAFYERYAAEYQRTVEPRPYLALPLAYIAFAQEEAKLFQYLFIRDMDLHMTAAEDFYREAGNAEKALAFARAVGLGPERARGIFLDLFLYAHGMAVLTATGKLALSRRDAGAMVENLLSALIRQAEPGGAGAAEKEEGEQDGNEPLPDGIL